MLKRIIFCTCIFLIAATRSFSQVNLQTGSATFSLPMFNWQDDKSRLNSVVALSYNSGNGLKVNDVASNVGQGWNLVAGGVITRMQVGEPDDQMKYNGNGQESDIRKYPNGYLYATTPASNGCPDALRKYPIYGHMNQVYTQHNSIAEDKQLDYFSFQFNGKAGIFVLDKTNGDFGLPLGDTKMKISFQRDPSMATNTTTGIRTTIKSFTIQDVDGLIYKFTQLGTTKVLESNYCDAGTTHPMTQPKFENGGIYYQAGFDNTSDPNINERYINPYVIGSWYLKEIEDALTHRKVIFNYVERNINTRAGEDISYFREKGYAVISRKTSVTKTPEITSISFPDGHNVTFNYGTPRIDMAGQFALAAVDITYNGRALSKYVLNTTYFILNRYGTPISVYQKRVARLCLKSVQKFGVDLKEETPPYIFDYHLGSSSPDDFVPPPFFYAKDVWGFYNGNNSVGYNSGSVPLNATVSNLNLDQLTGLCFIKNGVNGVYLNPKAGYAKNGLLKQIIYPTGGTLSYEYEQNSGILDGSARDVGGVHVSQTSSTDGGFSNGCSNPLTTQYHYVMNGTGSASSLWGLEMPANSVENSIHYKPEHRKYKWFGCGSLFGCCKYKYQYPGILSQMQAVSLSDFQKFMTAAAPVLGIISIASTIVDVVNLVCYSSGVMAWVAVVVDIISGLVTVVLTCFTNPEKSSTSTVHYNSDLNGVSPLPTQFKRVEVVENPGTIGKTVHEFTSEDDYPVWHLTNTTFSTKQRFAPWAYGLPKLITVFDNQNNKVKETENIYNFNTRYWTSHCLYEQPFIRSDLLKRPLLTSSCKCVVKNSTSQRNIWWSESSIYNDPASYRLASNSDMQVDIYDMYTGRTELNITHDRTFKPNGIDYLETKTEYVYNDENYQVKLIKTKKSQDNGDYDYSQKNIYYTIDYVKMYDPCYQLLPGVTATNAEISALVQSNIINQVVETNEMMSTYIGGARYTYDKAIQFTTLANGDIKPLVQLEGRFSQPAWKTPIWESIGGFGVRAYYFPQPLYNPSNAPDYTFYKAAQTFTYNSSTGVLTGIKDEAGRTVSNIYDYNDKYVVASVINADPSLDKYAYTSFETTVLGNWQLTGGIALYTIDAITGTRSLALTGRTLSSPLSTTKSHTLSFWASNTGVTVSAGATLTKSGPTLNGFTYYEYEVAQGTASVSLSGTSNIDEVRLFPKTARMRTVTYDELIGKTSECDENNRIIYYEYDKLGRLLFVKDEKMNIVKMYEYNNVSAKKQQGCPGIYYSHYTAETFAKDDCGVDYVGSDVTYTIPADKYTSTISQADADAKAENELLELGQQYANTNGTCIPIYKNQAQSQVFVSQNCEVGYTGGNVTYSVPADRYTSLISVADANQKALAEIEANGQAYANTNAVCVIDNNADWEWDNTTSYCLSVDGNLPPHLFIKETDVNPNSSTFNQTRWSDVGPDGACPANTYYNAQRSQSFTRNNCGSGYEGSLVSYSVPPGRYSSTVSQAAADQLAQNEINAYGQNYANSNGTCTPVAPQIDFWGENYVPGESFRVQLTNEETSEYFDFFAVDYGSNWLGYVPAGTYTITISSGSGNGYFYSASCQYFGWGSTYTFYGVTLDSNNSGCNIVDFHY